MQPLTCPIPSNINPLQTNGFLFAVQKLPEISFFCQEVTIPDLQLPMAETNTPLTNIRLPGDKPTFGDLTVNFLVDHEMNNFVAVHNWLIGMGFPESTDQYGNFIESRTDTLNRNEFSAAVSDGVLQVLGASNKAVRTIRFVDLFPVSLSSLTLTTTAGDTQYLAGVASFGYTYYKFE
jgi:hypothetical protein